MTNGYTRTSQIREKRRERAEAVQAANKRTPQEQLAHLNKLGEPAVKERAKIAKKLQKEATETPKKKG